MSTADEQPRTRPRRSWRRRWIPRLLVATFTLLLVIIVTTEIVLRTTIPKQIVIAQVEKTLGLHVTAASLSTGWLGHTTLRDVRVSLPLSDSAFVSLPELRVDHTILPTLLITQSLDIHSITLNRPVVTVTQDRFGRWNLQDVAAVLLKLGGENQAAQTSKSSPFVLPAVSLIDGEIDITDNVQRHATLAPLNVTGTVVNALVWKYDIHLDPAAGGHIALSGRVVPSDNFDHEINFNVSQLAPVAKPWIAHFDPNATLAGNWHGGMKNGGVSGRLLLQLLQYQTLSANNGDFAVQIDGSGISVTPSSLTAQLAQNIKTQLRITGGSIHADGASAKVDRLDVQALDGHVRVDGALTYADRSANLTADWNDLTAGPSIDTTGRFTASLRPEWPDRHSISARFTMRGDAVGTPYSADLQFTAAGKAWDAADATINAPALSLNGKTPIRLDGLAAHLSSHPGEIDLTDLSLDGGALAGAGAIKFDAQRPAIDHYQWWIHLLGQHIALPSIPNTSIRNQTAAFAVNATGDQNEISIKKTYGTIGQIVASAEGLYRFEKPRPVDVNVTISDTTDPAVAAVLAATTTATAPASSPLVQGHIRGDLGLTGTAYPLDLSLDGQLHARGLIVGDRPLQDVDVKCNGNLDSSRFVFDTDELKLLGGQWKLHAESPGSQHMPQATLTFHDLDLTSVGDLLHQADISGTAAGAIRADFAEFKPDQVHVDGQFSAHTVHARQLQIDAADGSISLQNSELAVAPIHLTHADGHADASIRLNIFHPG